KENEKTAAGIFLPQTAEEKSDKGEVVAVGPGKLLDNGSRAPMSVKPGDKVIFDKYGGEEIKINKEEFIIVSEDKILAIIS
ncbi:MAG: co-chaperone GroES, partial [Patescibacteria group bacterium]|nr:co-chaperone GroES [Patescibacteria group bacterium]